MAEEGRAVLSIIVPISGGDMNKPPTDPDYGVPIIPHPPIDLPGHPAHPDRPGGRPPTVGGGPAEPPVYPDQGPVLPPAIPTHPIELPPDADLPPGHVWPPLVGPKAKSITLVWIPYHGWYWVVVDTGDGAQPKK